MNRVHPVWPPQHPQRPPTRSPHDLPLLLALPYLLLRTNRVPCALCTQCLPSYGRHDLPLHALDVALDRQLVLPQLTLAALVEVDPRSDDDACERDCHGEVDPEVGGDDRVGVYSVLVLFRGSPIRRSALFARGDSVEIFLGAHARLTSRKVEKCHAKHRGEVGPRQEDGTEEGESLHGGAVVLRGVGEVLLLLRDLKAKLRLPDGRDVVQLVPVSSYPLPAMTGP